MPSARPLRSSAVAPAGYGTRSVPTTLAAGIPRVPSARSRGVVSFRRPRLVAAHRVCLRWQALSECRPPVRRATCLLPPPVAAHGVCLLRWQQAFPEGRPPVRVVSSASADHSSSRHTECAYYVGSRHSPSAVRQFAALHACCSSRSRHTECAYYVSFPPARQRM